jgi:hypothetical protein
VYIVGYEMQQARIEMQNDKGEFRSTLSLFGF